jgi:Flp pilus assembly protein TadB
MMSRQERRQLRQIERNLYAADPHWAKLISGGWPSRQERKRRTLNMTLDVIAVVLLVLGLLANVFIAVIAGVVTAVFALRLHVARRRRGGNPRLAH